MTERHLQQLNRTLHGVLKENEDMSINLATPEQWDAVTNPKHYKKSADAIECIDAIKSSMDADQFKGYLKGNVQKYVWRYENHPNGRLISLQKANIYLGWLIEAES